jgi:hypothetical protein
VPRCSLLDLAVLLLNVIHFDQTFEGIEAEYRPRHCPKASVTERRSRAPACYGKGTHDAVSNDTTRLRTYQAPDLPELRVVNVVPSDFLRRAWR